MNYYGAKELAASFRTVRKNTLKIAEDIPDNQYGFRPAKESRSVAESLMHLALTTDFQLKFHGEEKRRDFAGIDFAALIKELQDDERRPRKKDEILELLRSRGEKYARWLESCSEEFLGEQVALMPGHTPASQSRFEMLLGVKEHEMHHHGQLMQTERMLGIVPHLTREREARMPAAKASRAGA